MKTFNNQWVSVSEAINRGNNLVAVSILGLSGLSFLPELFFEDEWQHKLDEAGLFLIGVGALFWYLRGKNKFSRSVVPVILIIGALLVKLFGVILEITDKEDVGDDFGALILFLLSSILIICLYKKIKE